MAGFFHPAADLPVLAVPVLDVPIFEVPVLTTGRLRLRGHRVGDFPHCAAMWGEPEVTRYIGGKPLTEEESWMKLLRYVGHWALLGFGFWVVEEKASGDFVGEVGFADYKRDLEPSMKGVPEIGWALVSGAHGKGYATEAVRAVMAWGDAHFAGAQTACIVDPENLASVRVAVKCGYREFQLTSYRGHAMMMFVRERGESV